MRNRILNFVVLISLVSAYLLPLFITKDTLAISGSDFSAGRIIDDVVFRDKNSMSVQQIQNFLNAKVPTCDRNHTGFTGSSGNTYSPPWTCLKEYNENTSTLQNNIGQFNADGSPYQVPGGISAAQIIWNAGQQYNINPQVILATLQKESGIVTDTWAASWQYKTAMGYGCPDTGPNNSANCSANYFGFYNQVNGAAWQFNQYIINPSSYNFQSGVTRYIQFNPDVNCGGSNVAIQTAATAALYNYTPYQPNSSALSGLNDSSPGGIVSCGAYGNRNFWWYFTEWFGSTYAPSYGWTMVSQFAYTDQTMSNQVNINDIQPGQKIYAGFTALNTGNMTWQNSGNNSVMVGTNAPQERKSVFSAGSNWLSPTRPATMQQSSVAPGQIATFYFWMTAPSAPGSGGVYNERFNLLANGITWFNDTGLSYYFNVKQPTYSWTMVSQFAYTDQTMSNQVNINDIQPGQKIYAGFTALNTGNMTWQNSGNNSVMVGTNAPQERKSVFSAGSNWLSPTRPATMQQSSVAPGQIATFYFWMTAPSAPGSGGVYNERFNLLANGITWFNDTGLSYYFNVKL